MILLSQIKIVKKVEWKAYYWIKNYMGYKYILVRYIFYVFVTVIQKQNMLNWLTLLSLPAHVYALSSGASRVKDGAARTAARWISYPELHQDLRTT